MSTLPMREAPTTIRMFDPGGHTAIVIVALLVGEPPPRGRQWRVTE